MIKAKAWYDSETNFFILLKENQLEDNLCDDFIFNYKAVKLKIGLPRHTKSLFDHEKDLKKYSSHLEKIMYFVIDAINEKQERARLDNAMRDLFD